MAQTKTLEVGEVVMWWEMGIKGISPFEHCWVLEVGGKAGARRVIMLCRALTSLARDPVKGRKGLSRICARGVVQGIHMVFFSWRCFGNLSLYN